MDLYPLLLENHNVFQTSLVALIPPFGLRANFQIWSALHLNWRTMVLFLARCICCTTRIYKVLYCVFVCSTEGDMPLPPDAYPPGRPSAYLNAHYELRCVETIDADDRFEKIHLACAHLFLTIKKGKGSE